MTAFSITVPILRISPNYVPQRDLVLSAADSLEMTVKVVQTDDPASLPIDLSGGIGGPALTLFVWPWACFPRRWDYGAPFLTTASPLWSGDGTITDATNGIFTITFPPGTMAAWPARACWSLQLGTNHSGASQQLVCGYLHAMPSGQRLVTPTAITTDSRSVILVA